jgi:hypothetical protein
LFDSAPKGGSVEILVDSNTVGNAMLGLLRPDVAAHFDGQHLRSGWSFTMPCRFTLGIHVVQAVAVDSLGNRMVLGSKAITVKY